MLLFFRVVFVADRSRFEDARRKRQVYRSYYNLNEAKFQEGRRNASTFSCRVPSRALLNVDSPEKAVFFALGIS